MLIHATKQGKSTVLWHIVPSVTHSLPAIRLNKLSSTGALDVYFQIFTLPVFSATINIRKILTFNFR